MASVLSLASAAVSGYTEHPFAGTARQGNKCAKRVDQWPRLRDERPHGPRLSVRLYVLRLHLCACPGDQIQPSPRPTSRIWAIPPYSSPASHRCGCYRVDRREPKSAKPGDLSVSTDLSQDRPRRALCDQHDRRVGVAGSDGGHRRSIDYSKAGDAVHAAVSVEHRGG